ncbi:MAG: hypothetical protein WD851_04110 [Pirellulales bacterium]
MLAVLVAFVVAISSQVTGGGGRYGTTPPASDPAEFGGLFAEEPAMPPAAKGATLPAAGNGAANDATVGTPALPERATAAPTIPGTTPFPPTNRSGLPGGPPRESVYGNVAVPPAVSQPLNRRSAAEPTELIKAILTKPSDSQLTGTPIGLSEVVQGADSRAEQSERIEAYWDLCSATADYYLGLIEQRELAHLQRQQPAMGAALRQADTELRARVATAQRSARAAQLRLASLMGRSLTSELPLPEDTPHCGEYITRYEERFGKSSAPEAAELHALLPLRHAEIEAAAQAVARSEQWVHAVASSGATDNTGILRALELLALHRRAFVQLTRDYNRKITRYTELATPGRLETGRLVAMLIRTGDAPAVAQRTTEPSRSAPRGEVPPATVPQTFVTPPATSF